MCQPTSEFMVIMKYLVNKKWWPVYVAKQFNRLFPRNKPPDKELTTSRGFSKLHPRLKEWSLINWTLSTRFVCILSRKCTKRSKDYYPENSLTWWRHQMETFSALLALCAGNSPVPGEFPTQRPVTRSFDVFLDLRPNKWLNKHSWGWWFEMPSRSLWRHCNDNMFQRQWVPLLHLFATAKCSI